MNIFNEYSSGTILIVGLLLWFFIGKFTNSISKSKKNNDNDLEKDNTKHSKENTSIVGNAKENETQKCPYCAEDINIEAIVCLYCGAEYTRYGLSWNGKYKWVRGDFENSNEGSGYGCLIILLIITLFLIGFFILGPLISWYFIFEWLDSL